MCSQPLLPSHPLLPLVPPLSLLPRVGLLYPILTHMHILWHEAVSIASLVDLLFLKRTSNVGLRAVLKTLVIIFIDYARALLSPFLTQFR